MALPIVAVVGRPNVGKSTFVNRITHGNDAIVHEMRGVTRDRSYHEAEWSGVHFTLIDTGGIEMGDDDVFQGSIREQAFMGAEEADAIVFIDESAMWEFYQLGLGDPWPISSEHGHGTGDLLDAVIDVIRDIPEREPEVRENIVNVAIIGRPNAGKSSLTNRLIGKERSIVSDVAGTTRDAIDTTIEHEGTFYTIVDTAGLRRKAQIDQDVEYYGFVRAMRAIDRADVALLVVDATLGLTDQDQRVAGYAHERGCALAILLNKRDAVESGDTLNALREDIEERMNFVRYAPVLSISALTGKSVDRIWNMIDDVFASYSAHITTGKLNAWLQTIREFGFTVSKGKRRLKLKYVTQTRTCPPQFTVFCNMPDLVNDNFERYLENRFRQTFELPGTPIVFKFKKRD